MNPATQTPQTTGTMGLLSQLNRVVYRRATEDVLGIKLKQLIARGEVRYAFLNSNCSHHASTMDAACSLPARWIRAHGTDVSRQAGLSRNKVLWLLPGAPG